MAESYSVEAVLTAVDRGFTSGMNNAKSAVNSLTSSTGKTIQKMGSGIAAVGGAMTKGLTLPLIGVGTALIKTGADFQSQMSRVKAISGATESQFQALEAQAIDLGAATIFSASEVAEAQEVAASAGMEVNEMLEAMPGLMDLAAVSGKDMALATEAVTAAMNQFGIEAKHSGHVADVYARAAADTNAETRDMAEAMKYAGPVAGALGLSLEETAAAIGVMSDAGIKGSEAGTALRGGLLRLTNPSKKAQEAMDALGFSAFDANGNMKPLNKMLPELRQGLKGLTNEQKNAALATIFGQNAVSGMMALVNKSPEEFNKLIQSLENSGGAAKEMADIMNDNLAGAFEGLMGSLETASINIFKMIEPMLKGGIEAVDQVVTAFNKLDPAIQRNIVKWSTVAAATGPVLVAFGKVTQGIGKLVTSYGQGLNRMITGVQGFVSATKGGFGQISKFASSTGKSMFNAFNQAVGPAAKLVGRIKGIGKEWLHATQTTKVFSGVMKTAGMIGGEAIAIMSKKFGFLTPHIKGATSSLVGFGKIGVQSTTMTAQAIGKLALAALSVVGPVAGIGAVLALAGVAMTAFGDQITSVLNKITTMGPQVITNFADGILSALPGLIDAGVQMLSLLGEAITANLPVIMQKGVEIIIALVQGVSSNIDTIIQTAVSVISAFLNGIITAIPQLMVAGLKFILSLIQGINSNIGMILSAAQTILSNFINEVITNLPTILTTGMQIILELIQGLSIMLPALLVMGLEALTQIVQGISDNLDTIIQGGIAIIAALVSGIVNNLDRILQAGIALIVAVITGIIENLPKLALAGVQIVGELLRGVIEAAPKLLEAGVQLAKDLLKGIKDTVVNLGKDAWNGLWESWNNTVDKIETERLSKKLETAMDIAERAVSSSAALMVNEVRLIGDSFKEMGYTVQQVGEGFEIINDASGKVVASGNSMATGLAKAFLDIASNAQESASSVNDSLSSMGEDAVTVTNNLEGLAIDTVDILGQIESESENSVNRTNDILSQMGFGVDNSWMDQALADLKNSMNSMGASAQQATEEVNYNMGMIPQVVGEHTAAAAQIANANTQAMNFEQFYQELPPVAQRWLGEYNAVVDMLTAETGDTAYANTSTIMSMQEWWEMVPQWARDSLAEYGVTVDSLTQEAAQSAINNTQPVEQAAGPYNTFRTQAENALNGMHVTLPQLVMGMVQGIFAGTQGVIGAELPYQQFAANAQAAMNGMGMILPAEALSASSGVVANSQGVAGAGDAYQNTGQAMSNAMGTMSTNVNSTIAHLNGTIATNVQHQSNIFQKGYSEAAQKVTGAMNTMRNGVQGRMNGIKADITSGMNSAKSTFTSGFNSMKSTTTSAMSSIKSTISSGMNAIVSQIKIAMTNAVSAMRSAAGQAQSAGYQMGAGFLAGLNSMAGAIIGRAYGIAAAAAAAMRSALAIRSPSRVAIIIGEYLGEGLAVGIEGMIRMVEKASEKLGLSAIPEVDMHEFNAQFKNPKVISFMDYRFKDETATNRRPQPVIVNVDIGGRNYGQFVADITDEQAAQLRLNSAY